jgi:hypothetical protein
MESSLTNLHGHPEIRLDSEYNYGDGKNGGRRHKKPQSAVTRGQRNYNKPRVDSSSNDKNGITTPSEQDNKTECLSIDDVSNCCSDDEKKEDGPEQTIEQASLVVSLDKRKLSKKGADLDSITPDELVKLKKIFGPGFEVETNDKPDSALGFMPSHMKEPKDDEIMIGKFKQLQKAEELR